MTKEKIKMKPSIWRRVDIQVSLFTAIVVALLTFSIFWFQYRITYNDTLIRPYTDMWRNVWIRAPLTRYGPGKIWREMSISRPMKRSRGSGRFPVSGISIPQR